MCVYVLCIIINNILHLFISKYACSCNGGLQQPGDPQNFEEFHGMDLKDFRFCVALYSMFVVICSSALPLSSHARINFWYLEILPETLSFLGKQIKHIKLITPVLR